MLLLVVKDNRFGVEAVVFLFVFLFVVQVVVFVVQVVVEIIHVVEVVFFVVHVVEVVFLFFVKVAGLCRGLLGWLLRSGTLRGLVVVVG